MKRGADKQLTKDTDDDDIEEIQDPQGFHKADEAALAKRQIRALPKRALTASRPPALNGLPPAPASDVDKVDAPPPLKFGGFAGFGAGSSVSNPFTFATSPSSILAPPLFGAPKQPPVESDAFSAKPAESSPPAEDTDVAAFKYFKSLRGLNVSFLSAISTAVDKDPFCDVASLIDSYKNLRTTIQSEFDGTLQHAPITTNPPPFFGSKASLEKTPPLFSMPKAPVGSTEASFKPSSASDSGSKTSSFAFPPFVPPSTAAPPQLPFGLTPKSSESSSVTPTEPPKPVSKFPAFSPPAAMSSTPNFTFAASSVESASKPASSSTSQDIEILPASSSSQPFSTTPNFGSGSIFTAANSTVAPDASSKPTSVFGSSIFGNSSTIESSKPSPFNPSPPDSKEGSKATTPVFGSTSATLAPPTNIFGSSSDKPVSLFGSATLPKPSPFTFGKPAGSIGNPVGFGFGSPSSGAGDGSSTPGFSFGSSKPTESLFSPPMTDKSLESTPQPETGGNEEGGEEAVKLLPSQSHDEEGEGEEDEETAHVVRCKLFRLTKTGDNSEWKDLGVGMFRLKIHKETKVRRVLMRNSSTGRILMNFRVYAGLKPSLAKTVISFVGYDNSTPTSFRIRVKTEEQATELKQAMEREVEAVQAGN